MASMDDEKGQSSREHLCVRVENDRLIFVRSVTYVGKNSTILFAKIIRLNPYNDR